MVFNVPCKISRVFYKLAYFRLGLGRTDIHSRGNDTSFVKIEDETYDFLVEEWRIEGCVTKVIERILMNVGLLILHKIKVLIL